MDFIVCGSVIQTEYVQPRLVDVSLERESV